MKVYIASALISLFGVLPALAGDVTGTFINKSAAAVAFQDGVDLDGFKSVSIQTVFSNGTPSNHTLVSGSSSSANITVSDYTKLSEKRAQVSITVASNSATALSGAYITLNGVSFIEGIHWTRGGSAVDTANRISSAIADHSMFVSTDSASVVYASAALTGTYSNTWAVTSSTPAALVLSASQFAGGQENAFIEINGTRLTQGTDWNAVTSNNVTAENIENAIQGNSALSAIIIATHNWTSPIVYATSTTNGINAYSISLSTSALVASSPWFSGGSVSNIDPLTDTITKANHGLTTGLAVNYSTGSGTQIGGLTVGTTYYAIRLSDTQYQLATSSTNAVAGTAVNITSNGTSQTITMKPCVLTGTPAFKWQASNDGTNFSDLKVTSVDLVQTSVTYSSAGNVLWDFGTPAYRYIRMNYTGPTFGGLAISATLNGKK